jgi:hypothetical protein
MYSLIILNLKIKIICTNFNHKNNLFFLQKFILNLDLIFIIQYFRFFSKKVMFNIISFKKFFLNFIN